MTSRRLPPPSAPRPPESAPRDHRRSGHARRKTEARIGSRIDLEKGGRHVGIPLRPRFGDPLDRRTRGMLCTRAAALSQVQQPAGQPPAMKPPDSSPTRRQTQDHTGRSKPYQEG